MRLVRNTIIYHVYETWEWVSLYCKGQVNLPGRRACFVMTVYDIIRSITAFGNRSSRVAWVAHEPQKQRITLSSFLSLPFTSSLIISLMRSEEISPPSAVGLRLPIELLYDILELLDPKTVTRFSLASLRPIPNHPALYRILIRTRCLRASI